MNTINIFVYMFAIFFYQNQDVQGLWITEDDETGKKKSEVLIYKEGNKVYGKIINLILPKIKANFALSVKVKIKINHRRTFDFKRLNFGDDTWDSGTF